ncbi:uncharacterized protein [Gossypium hirsutum]|uniref:RVP_2 domain-containing protein n=1 Tax=Gossypium hirsutum TaxID=3635 RepID=A0A1U8NFJ1_GOSHI|nr:uncharacterized protein LOC107947768 [Gossypium hirsutum]
MVASEYEKCVHFEDGFRDSLRVLIAQQKEHEFVVLMDKAKIAEERPKKWARPNGPIRMGVPVALTRMQPCSDCGKRHPGKCWRRLGAFLQCGSLEHWIRECPHHTDQMQASGPSSVQPQRAVQQPPKGHGPVRGGNDIGSTHSYVASTISKNLGISVEFTSSEITVLSLLGQSVRVNRLYRNVPLEIQGTKFLTNLIELPFGEFDLILSMDWLFEHRVSLDCVTKRVVLRILDDEKIVVTCERRDYLSNVIFTLVTEKLVRKGCEAFLAYVSVSVSGDFSIRDIRTVRDFLDVFPEELPGLPPNQEVEFGIELLPSTTLVSIAPYHMAPNELTKLKAQL